MISKVEGGKEGREMKFVDNEQNREFKNKIANLIFFRKYIEAT